MEEKGNVGMIRLAKQSEVHDLIKLYTVCLGKRNMIYIYIRNHVINKNIYVLEISNNIIGAYYTSYKRLLDPHKSDTSSTEIYWIEQLMVHPSHQHMKYGTQMIEHYINLMDTNRSKEMRLTCTEQLVSYYKRFGFEFVYKDKSSGKEYYLMNRKII